MAKQLSTVATYLRTAAALALAAAFINLDVGARNDESCTVCAMILDDPVYFECLPAGEGKKGTTGKCEEQENGCKWSPPPTVEDCTGGPKVEI